MKIGAGSQYRPPFLLDCIYYAVSIGFFVTMFYYYWTGAGGPVILAMVMIPITFVLFTLQGLRQNDLYPKLPMVGELCDRRGLLPVLDLLRLLHVQQLHGARLGALRHVE